MQQWIPIETIYDDGLIKMKNQSFLKIIIVCPINYQLKSDFEKEAIINAYKIFLKNCNFNIQILIQSTREDINEIIENINKINLNESKKIKKIKEEYCKYIKKLNFKNKFSSKKFYILIKKIPEKNKNNSIEIIQEELNANYLKIKESLSRCGNTVNEVISKNEIKKIIKSFINKKYY